MFICNTLISITWYMQYIWFNSLCLFLFQFPFLRYSCLLRCLSFPFHAPFLVHHVPFLDLGHHAPFLGHHAPFPGHHAHFLVFVRRDHAHIFFHVLFHSRGMHFGFVPFHPCDQSRTFYLLDLWISSVSCLAHIRVCF